MNIKKSIVCFFLSFSIIINCFYRPVVQANPLAAAIPVFAGSVGTVTVASAATVFGVVLLIGAGCYGVYKLSQPSTQDALKKWASARAADVESGVSSFGVYVDSKGQLFCDNISSLKKSFDDAFSDRSDAIPAFPDSTWDFKGAAWNHSYQILYKNVSNDVYSISVLMPDESAGSDFTHTFTVNSRTALVNDCCLNDKDIVYNWGVETNSINSDGTVAFAPGDCSGNSHFFALDYKGHGLPYITSVKDVGLDKTLDVYPNLDKSKDFSPPSGATSVSLPVSDSQASSVTKDTDLTKVTPISSVSPVNTGQSSDTSGFWGTLWDWLSKILAAITAIPGAIGSIATAIQNFPNYSSKVLEYLESIPGVIGSIATAVADLPTYFPKVLGYLETMPGAIGAIATGVADLPQALTGIGNFIADFPANLEKWIESVPGAVTGAFTGLKDWITDIPGTIIDGLKSLFIPDSISEPFKDIIDDMKQKINLKYSPVLPSKMLDLKSGQDEFKDITINYNLNFGAINLGSGTAVIVSAKQINSHIGDVRLLTSVVMSFFFFFYVYSEIYFAIRGVKPFETSNKDVTAQYSDCGGDGKK